LLLLVSQVGYGPDQGYLGVLDIPDKNINCYDFKLGYTFGEQCTS